MNTNVCEVKEQKMLKVLQSSAVVPMEKLPDTLGEIFNSVIGYLQEIGEAPAGPAFAAYYNQDMSALKIDAGFVVAKDVPETEHLKMAAIPECKVAAYMHIGPYPELVKAYSMLMEWAKEQGLELVGTGYELYYNSPMNTPPEELKTEILFPVK